LKRWDDEALPEESDAKPSGLGYTLMTDQYSNGPKKDDDVSMLFQISEKASTLLTRIQIYKPTPEHEDLFSKLSESDMNALKGRFKDMKNALVEAQKEKSIKKACKLLKQEFGRDFPVPDDDESVKGGYSVRAERTTQVQGNRFA